MANLTTCDLAENEFNGSIPESISWFQNLWYLALGDKHLIGTILVELGELTSFQTLVACIQPIQCRGAVKVIE